WKFRTASLRLSSSPRLVRGFRPFRARTTTTPPSILDPIRNAQGPTASLDRGAGVCAWPWHDSSACWVDRADRCEGSQACQVSPERGHSFSPDRGPFPLSV